MDDSDEDKNWSDDDGSSDEDITNKVDKEYNVIETTKPISGLDDVFGGASAIQRDDSIKPKGKAKAKAKAEAGKEADAEPKEKTINSLTDTELKNIQDIEKYAQIITNKVATVKDGVVKNKENRVVTMALDGPAEDIFAMGDWDKALLKIKQVLSEKRTKEKEDELKKIKEKEAEELEKKKKEAEEAGEEYVDDEDFYAQFE